MKTDPSLRYTKVQNGGKPDWKHTTIVRPFFAIIITFFCIDLQEKDRFIFVLGSTLLLVCPEATWIACNHIEKNPVCQKCIYLRVYFFPPFIFPPRAISYYYTHYFLIVNSLIDPVFFMLRPDKIDANQASSFSKALSLIANGIRSRRLRWEGKVVQAPEDRGIYKALLGKELGNLSQ